MQSELLIRRSGSSHHTQLELVNNGLRLRLRFDCVQGVQGVKGVKAFPFPVHAQQPVFIGFHLNNSATLDIISSFNQYTTLVLTL
jgi:hypothetical protein